MKCLLHTSRNCSLSSQCMIIILRHTFGLKYFYVHQSMMQLFFDCYKQIEAKGSVHTKGLLRFPLRIVNKF